MASRQNAAAQGQIQMLAPDASVRPSFYLNHQQLQLLSYFQQNQANLSPQQRSLFQQLQQQYQHMQQHQQQQKLLIQNQSPLGQSSIPVSTTSSVTHSGLASYMSTATQVRPSPSLLSFEGRIVHNSNPRSQSNPSNLQARTASNIKASQSCLTTTTTSIQKIPKHPHCDSSHLPGSRQMMSSQGNYVVMPPQSAEEKDRFLTLLEQAYEAEKNVPEMHSPVVPPVDPPASPAGDDLQKMYDKLARKYQRAKKIISAQTEEIEDLKKRTPEAKASQGREKARKMLTKKRQSESPYARPSKRPSLPAASALCWRPASLAVSEDEPEIRLRHGATSQLSVTYLEDPVDTSRCPSSMSPTQSFNSDSCNSTATSQLSFTYLEDPVDARPCPSSMSPTQSSNSDSCNSTVRLNQNYIDLLSQGDYPTFFVFEF